jgi:hypothetical protein
VIPALTPSFDYLLIAKVDDQEGVPELVETNNVAISTATVAVLPSLVGTFPVELGLAFAVARIPARTAGAPSPSRSPATRTPGARPLAISLARSYRWGSGSDECRRARESPSESRRIVATTASSYAS